MLLKWFEKIRKSSRNNKGMALITVVICIGFIATLVSVLLMTTLVNFKMKSVNEQSKDTFYSAEQALDEINVGLQRLVSDSMSTAYLDIMTNYEAETSKVKVEKLRTTYYESLWSKLEAVPASGISNHEYYDVTVLEGMLKETTKWHTNGTSDYTDANGYGAIITALDSNDKESKEGIMMSYEDGIVLKGLKVYYKDPNGFVSIIQTDIRIAYPDFDFAPSSELPNIADYVFIADAGIEFDNGAGSYVGTAALDGDIYADSITCKGRVSGTTGGTQTATITTGKENIITVKNDVNLTNAGIEMDEDNVLWASSVRLGTSDNVLQGTVNLSNDLEIKGQNTTVKLIGELMGYGNYFDKSKSYLSSAILVNGIGTTIDMSELDKITIAGHAYVGTSRSKYSSDAASLYATPTTSASSDTEDEKNTEIRMGESLAVKSNQLLYLVPAAAIGVDETTGRSLYNKNPLTLAEYNDIMDKVAETKSTSTASVTSGVSRYVEISDSVELSELGSDLSPYIRYSDGYPTAQKVFVQVSDVGTTALVYYYMDFASESAANEYYSVYYAQNKTAVQKYTNLYLDKVVFPNTNNLVTFKTAGNILTGVSSSLTTDADWSEEGFANQPASVQSASDQLNANRVSYSDQFRARCTKLVDSLDYTVGCKSFDILDYANLDLTKSADQQKLTDSQVVYENIVSVGTSTSDGQLKEFIDNAYDYEYVDGMGNVAYKCVKTSSKTVEFQVPDSLGTYHTEVIISEDEDVTIGGSNKDVVLVITGGDVTVSTNEFNGVILCDGKVTVTQSGAILNADPSAVKRCLEYSYQNASNGDFYTVAYVLTDGNEYVYASLDDSGDVQNLALGGLISYENWKKE